MPVGALIGSAVIGGGAAVYSASSANKAAGKAADKTSAAADASTAEARRQYDLSRADNAPWKAVGQGALGILAQQYGISVPQAQTQSGTSPTGLGGSPSTSSATGAAPFNTAGADASALSDNFGQTGGTAAATSTPSAQGGQPAGANDQWQRYLQENPDVIQGWESEKNAPEFGGDINKWAQYHYQNYGKSEGRQLPTGINASGIPASLPGAGPTLPARQDYTRPAEVARPTMARPETAPLRISPADYQASPDLQFQLDEARKGTVAGARASGSLQSGAAAKALQDRAQNIGYGDFNNWVNRQIGIFDTANARSDNNYAFDTNRADQNFVYDTNRRDNIFSEDRAYGTDVFNSDRGYLTGRYDKRTGDLFSLAGMGTSANAADARAGQDYADTSASNLFSTAAAQGKAGQQVAANNSQAVGNILGLGAGVIANLPKTQPRPSSNVLG